MRRTQRALVLLAFTLSIVPLAAQQKDGCIPAHPYGDTPTMDGVLTVERGWFGALRLNMNDSLGVPRTAYVDIVERTNELYFGILIDEPDSTNTDDIVVIGLSTTNNRTEDWRVQFKPWPNPGSSCPTGTPFETEFWRDSTLNSSGVPTWNTANSLTPGTTNWLHCSKGNIRVAKQGNSWSVEMKVPVQTNANAASGVDKVYFPFSGSTFKFYINVLSTDTLVGTYSQAPWPRGVEIVPPAGGGFLDNLMPDMSQWGVLSLFPRTDCTGITITEAGVRHSQNTSDPLWDNLVTGTPPGTTNCGTFDNTVPFGPDNYLVARVRNNMAIPASVSMTYAIRNFGIPGPANFETVTAGLVGGSTNPISQTAAPNPIAANGGTGEFVIDWRPTQQQACVYNPGTHCSRVLIDSTDGNVRFLDRDLMLNLNIVQASRAEVPAEISAVGYDAVPGRQNQRFILNVSQEVQRYQKARDNAFEPVRKRTDDPQRTGATRDTLFRIAAGLFPRGLEEALSQIVRGYRTTGRYLTIDRRNGNRYEYAEYVGGYQIIAGHNGRVKAWTNNLVGPTIQKRTEKRYTIEIPQNAVARVQSVIEAQPGCMPGNPQALMLFSLALAAVGVVVHLPRRRNRQRVEGR